MRWDNLLLYKPPTSSYNFQLGRHGHHGRHGHGGHGGHDGHIGRGGPGEHCGHWWKIILTKKTELGGTPLNGKNTLSSI